MYAIAVTIELEPGSQAAFMPLMLENARASSGTEPGCQKFDVCSNDDQPGRVFLFEMYDDKAAFDSHLATAHFKTFQAPASAMIKSSAVSTYDTVMR